MLTAASRGRVAFQDSREKEPVPMSFSNQVRMSFFWIALLPLGQAVAVDPSRQCLYEVTLVIYMPHLEENLRYTTIHEQRYLSSRDFATAFPALRQPALSDCHLVPN